MTTIYLIRHAEAEGNLYRRAHGWYNSTITDRGYRQIAALAKRFADTKFDAVYSSDRFRTMITALSIYKTHGLPLRIVRALREQLPEHFGQFRPVAALAAGVLGTTGVESADMIRALAAHLRPDAIIAVDALACAELDRLGRTVQLTDTGITPSSGVGNDRAGLSRDTLGIPVAAIGLPTVIDAGGFSDDPRAEQMFVTPRDVDTVVRDAAKLIGYGINLALHDGLTIGDVDMFLS